MTRQLPITAFSALALIATAGLLSAGPLNPPAGPVIGTAKPLSEVEPRTAVNATNTPGDATSLFKITQPGSYYLTGNITGELGKHGIVIAANGVTLDLNGFNLTGVSGMGTFDGVYVSTGTGIAITNGSVVGWGRCGINAGQALAARVERVSSTANRSDCIKVSSHAIVSDCSASDSVTGGGIYCGENSTVTNCAASNNANSGVYVTNISNVSGCTTIGNNSCGIVAWVGCTVTGCTAWNNSLDGIQAGVASTAFNCSATLNGDNGINFGAGGKVSACSVYNNFASGITVGGGSTVSDCSVQRSTLDGILTGDGCTVSNCSVNEGQARGINTNNGCSILNCTTRNNQSDGIAVNYACTVTGNTCNGDGTAAGNQGGIRVLGQANRIEANNVTYADRGLLVDSSNNVIVRNTVKGCTINWVIAANNAVGPIVDRTAPASAAISGNSAPGSIGSTDPTANITY